MASSSFVGMPLCVVIEGDDESWCSLGALPHRPAGISRIGLWSWVAMKWQAVRRKLAFSGGALDLWRILERLVFWLGLVSLVWIHIFAVCCILGGRYRNRHDTGHNGNRDGTRAALACHRYASGGGPLRVRPRSHKTVSVFVHLGIAQDAATSDGETMSKAPEFQGYVR
jgi:hypothetical protein